MRVTKIKGIVLSILLSTLLLVGVDAAWGLSKIVVNSAIEILPGLPEDSIADLRASIATGELSAVDEENARLQVEITQHFADKMAEIGYTFEAQDWGWAEPLIQKQTIAFLAGIGQDVIIGETQMPGYAAQGYLEPFPEALAEKIRETVIPGAYLPLTVGGKIYGLSACPGVNVLFWNKDLFRAAGLDPEVGPKTWSEWVDMANKITAAGKGKFYGGGVYVGPHYGGSLRVGPFMMMTAGGGFVDENNDIQFTHPGNIKAFEFLRELNKNTPPGIAAAPGEGGFWNSFNQGQMGFVVDGPWRLAEGTSVGIDVGYSTLPIPDVDGREANVTIGAAFWAVPTYSKNKEAAFKFIMTFLDEYVQERNLILIRRCVVLKSWGADPENQKSFYYTIWLALQGQVAGLPTYNKQNAKVWDIFHQAETRAIMSTGSIEDIMRKAEVEAKALQ